MARVATTARPGPNAQNSFLLQGMQPALTGLIDGSLSTLAPIFAVALATHDTRYAFIAGLATSLGAAISMGFSEALSDTGELTGRGSPLAGRSSAGSSTRCRSSSRTTTSP